MHLLGCLFALLLGVIIIIVAFLGSIARAVMTLLGLKPNNWNGGQNHTTRSTYQQGGTAGNQQGGYRQDERSYQEEDRSQGKAHNSQPGHKIFERNENEYVDFEEV